MGQGRAEIDINKAPAEVWAVVGDFGNLAWMPGVDACTVNGDERTIEMLGISIVERLVSKDEASSSITYGIVGGGLQVDHHQATVTVSPGKTPGESHVSWDVDVAPDSLTDLMVSTYQGALEKLKETLEN